MNDKEVGVLGRRNVAGDHGYLRASGGIRYLMDRVRRRLEVVDHVTPWAGHRSTPHLLDRGPGGQSLSDDFPRSGMSAE